MRIYCTLFDGGYAARGLALVDSLNEHCSPFRLYVLCMDRDVEVLLDQLKIPNIVPIPLAELEREDRQLAEVKPTRTMVEYYFTSKASLVRYVLAKNPDCERVTYLDADIFYFSDPSELDREIAGSSVAVTEHRFSPGNRRLYKFGRFNAGWLSVRNNAIGHQCVEWWRNQCLEWCHDYIDGDRYADQKYMDKMPMLFNAAIVRHIGANLAPWNIGNYRLTYGDGRILVDGRPAIFFHFQGVKRIWGPFIETGFALYRQRVASVAKHALLAPYFEKWHLAEREIAAIRSELISQGSADQQMIIPKRVRRGSFFHRSRIQLASILGGLWYGTICLAPATPGKDW